MLRCPACRTRFALFSSLQKHLEKTGHKLCDCGGGGVYHYKHRPGSPYCLHNPMAPVRLAMLQSNVTDEELQEIEIEIAVNGQGRPLRQW